jgi:drug/metabolite transporter (DMT)-like permease
LSAYLAAGLALCSAMTFGLFSVMARKAMNLGSALTASAISVAVGIPIMFVLTLFFSSWEKLTLEAVFWFSLTGALAPGLARPLIYISIRHIGVGRAMPLVTLTPFVSTLAAIFWLGEEPGPGIFAATFLIVTGCVLISLKPEGDKDWRRIYLFLPLAHSLSMAFATTSRRYSLLVFPDFLIGALIASVAALPAMLLFLPVLPKEERFRIEPGGLRMMILCGLVNSLTFLIFFAAFTFGPVSVVVPIGYAAPLFALVFTRIWLRDEEVLTWQKCAGAVTLFIGVVLVVTFAR